MKTFEEVFEYICENKRSLFIFYTKNGNKVEFKSEDIRTEISLIVSYLKNVGVNSDKNKWIRLIVKDNCSGFFIMFSLLKLGFNVMLDDTAEKEDDIIKLDSDIYYNVDRKNLFYDLEDFCDNSWGNWIGFYSSGTTGKQKKIVYNSELLMQMLYNAEIMIKQSFVYDLIKKYDGAFNKKILSTLPIYHILGYFLPIIMRSFDCDVVFINEMSFNRVIEVIKKEHIIGAFGVPIMWDLIKNIANRKYKKFNNPIKELLGADIQIILSGGSKTSKEIREYYIKNGINFFVGYGMTELGFLSLSSSKISDIESEGYIYPMYEYRIIDDKGQQKIDGVGELIVDTGKIAGYMLNNGDIEKFDFIDGKYFRTGDIFCLNDGQLYFIGRKNHIIVAENGENILLDDIEEKIVFLKEKNILYCVNEHNGKIALYLDNHNRIIKDESDLKKLVDKIMDINKTLYITMKVKEIILINEKIKITTKGRLAIHCINKNSNIRVVNII